jgi:hypothetical protein
MAGSWRHMVKKNGKLRSPEHLVQMMDTQGDMVEALEECYGMIYWLANSVQMPGPITEDLVSQRIENANDHYRDGVHLGGSKTYDER